MQVPEPEAQPIEAFRRELDAGMWAAVPKEHTDESREVELVHGFAEIPRDAERVTFSRRPPARPRAGTRGPRAPSTL